MTTTLCRTPVRSSMSARLDGVSVCVSRPALTARPAREPCEVRIKNRPSGQVDVRRKSFDVLRYLIEHAGRVVTKEELIRAVWPDVTVGDESLTQCISEVRRALDDEGQRIVRTVPRRGYLIGVPISANNTTEVQ